MKQQQKQDILGRKRMEMAGALTPDLEGQASSRQHAARGISEGIDWGRLHDADRATITPHLGRKGGEH